MSNLKGVLAKRWSMREFVDNSVQSANVVKVLARLDNVYNAAGQENIFAKRAGTRPDEVAFLLLGDSLRDFVQHRAGSLSSLSPTIDSDKKRAPLEGYEYHRRRRIPGELFPARLLKFAMDTNVGDAGLHAGVPFFRLVDASQHATIALQLA